MTLNEYQERAMQTAIYREQIEDKFSLSIQTMSGDVEPSRDTLILDHMAKDYVLEGLQGEYSEHRKKPTIGELGGIMWYVAACAHEWGYKLQDVFWGAPTVREAQRIAFIKTGVYGPEDYKIVDDARTPELYLLGVGNDWKKVIRDDRTYDIRRLLKVVLVSLKLLRHTPEDIEQAMQYNLNQLAERAATGTIQGSGETVGERRG